MPRLLRRLAAALAAGLLAAAPAGGLATERGAPPAAAVASAHPQATRAGLAVLAGGGNAFDAAVTVTAVLAVAEPYGSGLGGGGFWLLHRAEDGRQVMVDGRETAPGAAHRDLYLDADGEIIPGASIDGALAAAIPGVPAALVHLAREYGRLDLATTLGPAIRLAREGVAVTPEYRRLAAFRQEVLQRHPRAAAIFLDQGAVPPVGHLLVQPELARTLEALAAEGREGFYAGPVAAEMVRAVREAGGIWTLEDLADYRVREREPVVARHGDWRLVSAPPPSSGGVALATMLNILAGFDLAGMDPVVRTHHVVEAMRLAYRDRARHLGDSDFVDVPLERLTSAAHAEHLRARIQPDRALRSAELGGAPGVEAEGRDTTHFSVLDREGNRVAATLSINYPFGAGMVAGATGVLLNDEMDDFAAKPGVPNVYGLVGARANAIAPGKRPLSSMSPTFLEGPGGVAILGTPGGSRIITMVLLGALEAMAGAPPAAWVATPRYHHQYLPDRLQHEPEAFAAPVRQGLAELGHRLEEVRPYGDMQAIWWDAGEEEVAAASDPRGAGSARVAPSP